MEEGRGADLFCFHPKHTRSKLGMTRCVNVLFYIIDALTVAPSDDKATDLRYNSIGHENTRGGQYRRKVPRVQRPCIHILAVAAA